MSDRAQPGTCAARADRTDRFPDGPAVRVLVVDDEPGLAELLASVLRSEGWQVRTAGDGLRAVRTGREFRPDAVVLVEINREWEEALGGVDKEYAYRYTARGKRGKGITLLSRWPVLAVDMLPGYSEVQSALAATLQIHGRSVQLLGIHATWPMGRRLVRKASAPSALSSVV